MQEIIQKLVDQGIAPAIAESLAKTMMKEAGKKEKKVATRKSGKTKSPKGGIEITVLVETSCLTCETQVTHKKKVFVKEGKEYETIQKISRSFCENCIRLLEGMPKEELISLITMQNHRDIEIRNFSMRRQLKLAKTKSALQWYLSKMGNAIPKPDEDTTRIEKLRAFKKK